MVKITAMEFFVQYGVFLLKALTIVVAILLTVAGVVAISSKGKGKAKLKIDHLNEHYEDVSEKMHKTILDKKEQKKFQKALKKKSKNKDEIIKKAFVIEFHGDIRASAVENLRNEVSAILTIAKPNDEVIVKIESPGGVVHGYGLAASQLQRLKDNKLKVIACVDKVAASGGYLMACVADKVYAAPFAIIGSIGVVAQIPNFNRLLKKKSIDYEVVTAGEFKRTLTMFGENTDKARKKFQEDIEDIHHAFKEHVKTHRPQVNIERVSSGEHWLASQAFDEQLVDKLLTSDDYLMNLCKEANVYQISHHHRMKVGEKIGLMMSRVLSSYPSHLL